MIIKDPAVKDERPTINVVWKDNGQIVMEMKCYASEVNEIKELLHFVGQLADKDLW